MKPQIFKHHFFVKYLARDWPLSLLCCKVGFQKGECTQLQGKCSYFWENYKNCEKFNKFLLSNFFPKFSPAQTLKPNVSFLCSSLSDVGVSIILYHPLEQFLQRRFMFLYVFECKKPKMPEYCSYQNFCNSTTFLSVCSITGLSLCTELKDLKLFCQVQLIKLQMRQLYFWVPCPR